MPSPALVIARFAGPDRILRVASDPATGRRITVWDIASGKVVNERPAPGDFDVMEVTPDGRRVAFCLTADGIALWDVATLQLQTDGGGQRQVFATLFGPSHA